jgi:hypothetical protein
MKAAASGFDDRRLEASMGVVGLEPLLSTSNCCCRI